ncbi:nuclear transport factor 2 family protein [Mycolicibacterium sp. XJ662]
MNARLQELCDRADILDCMQRYARGMDRRDRDLLRSAYHDNGVDEHIGFVGPVDDFIDWAFAYHRTQTRYQHYLLNHTADIAGDQAHAETYYLFVGTDREPPNHLIVNGGRYVDRLERRDDRWAIVARVCIVEWHTESTSLITDETMGFLADIMTVAHDRTDTSYDRPLTVTRAPIGP